MAKTQEELAAEEQARREEEEEEERREEERRRIQGEIDHLTGIQNTVDAQIAALSGQDSDLTECLHEWRAEKSRYYGIDIVSEVVIPNVFEGNCADYLKEKIAEGVMAMDDTCMQIEGLQSDVGSQIGRLEEYVWDIGCQISNLEEELARV